MDKLTKPLFTIIDSGGDKRRTMKLEDIRQYIHVEIDHRTYKFVDGKRTGFSKFMEPVRCKESYFQKNDYEKNYFKTVSEKQAYYIYCIPEEKDIYI